MINTVFVKEYDSIPVDKREILRYMGCREEDSRIMSLIDDALKEAESGLTYRVCYGEFEIKAENDTVAFPFNTVRSVSLFNRLKGYSRAIVFSATVGINIDRLIFKYGKLSPSRAVVLQAIGAERIEALCDAFCDDIKKERQGVTVRFSPGYGDLPLELQRDIITTLGSTKKIGLTLNESLLMSPSKSVTAVFGVTSERK